MPPQKKIKIFYKKVWKYKNFAYLCTRNTTTGCSAVRLAHLVWDQRVTGSNPVTPTKRKRDLPLFFVSLHMDNSDFLRSKKTKFTCSHPRGCELSPEWAQKTKLPLQKGGLGDR